VTVRQFSLRECQARPLACLRNWSRATSRRRNSLMRPLQQRRLRQLKRKNPSRNRSPKRKSPRQSRRLPRLHRPLRLHRRPGPLRRGSRWVPHRGQQLPDNSRMGRNPLGQRRRRLVRNNLHNRPNLCGRRRPKRRRHNRPSHPSRSGPIRRPPPVLRDKTSTRAAANCVNCRRMSFIK
jgi:hypothetical protein